ncbi:MAG: DUF5666 domain-containing protein [Candidatus Shapirobacteria bacterium]|nr:DUF5666 domain-containing protein [Candidatus Shapirobacteria bacterium]
MSEKENKFNKYILPVSLSFVFLIIGFGSGVLYQKNQLKTTFGNRVGQYQIGEGMGRGRNNQNGQGQGMGLRNGAGSGATFGEVTKIDDTSFTIKTVDGSSKIILISDSTAFNKSTTVSKTELKVGSQVRVDGTTDTNTGSVTGKSIEIDPARNGQTTTTPQQ